MEIDEAEQKSTVQWATPAPWAKPTEQKEEQNHFKKENTADFPSLGGKSDFPSLGGQSEFPSLGSKKAADDEFDTMMQAGKKKKEGKKSNKKTAKKMDINTFFNDKQFGEYPDQILPSHPSDRPADEPRDSKWGGRSRHSDRGDRDGADTGDWRDKRVSQGGFESRRNNFPQNSAADDNDDWTRKTFVPTPANERRPNRWGRQQDDSRPHESESGSTWGHSSFKPSDGRGDGHHSGRYEEAEGGKWGSQFQPSNGTPRGRGGGDQENWGQSKAFKPTSPTHSHDDLNKDWGRSKHFQPSEKPEEDNEWKPGSKFKPSTPRSSRQEEGEQGSWDRGSKFQESKQENGSSAEPGSRDWSRGANFKPTEQSPRSGAWSRGGVKDKDDSWSRGKEGQQGGPPPARRTVRDGRGDRKVQNAWRRDDKVEEDAGGRWQRQSNGHGQGQQQEQEAPAAEGKPGDRIDKRQLCLEIDQLKQAVQDGMGQQLYNEDEEEGSKGPTVADMLRVKEEQLSQITAKLDKTTLNESAIGGRGGRW